MFLSVSSVSAEDRNVAVDQKIGGMEQGRRIQSPGNYNNKGITSGEPGSTTTPAHDIHTLSQESQKAESSQGRNISNGGNHGFLYVQGQASNSADNQNGTNQASREQTNGLPAGQAGSTSANTSQSPTGQENSSPNVGSSQSGTGQSNGSATVNTGETPTGQTGSAHVSTGETSSGQTGGSVNVNAGQTGGSSEVNVPSTGTEQTSGSVGTGTVQTTTGQITNPVNTGSPGTTAPTETSPTGQIETGETQTGSGNSGTNTESSGTSNNPIVSVDANVNPNSGAADTSVHTDTSGQLEDRQIIDAGATTGQTSTQTETGSASGITGSEMVHQTDITIQPVAQTTQQFGTTTPNTTETNVGAGNGGIIVGGETSPTGQVGIGETQTGSGTSPTTTESSESSSNPIVGVDVNANPNTGEVSTGIRTDTSGQLEDRQIIDAGVATGQTESTGTQTGSASQITGSETIHQADVTTQPVADAAGQTGDTTTNVGTGNGGVLVGGETSPTGQVEAGETQTGNGPSQTTTESSGTSNNPIVAVDVNANPNSGAVDTGVHTDTSGQLEDRQIIDAGATGEHTGSTGVQTGSASQITGSETVHQTDLTTQPVTEATGQTGTGEVTTSTGNGGILIGGETSPTGQVGTQENIGGSSRTTQESSSGTSNPIVDVEAGVDQNSGMPHAEVTLDTSGELEERQILDADLTGETTGSTGAEIGGATDITDADLVEEADITTEVVGGTIGQTVPDQISGSTNGGTSSGSQTHTEESSSTSSNPIVDIGTNINPESGTADVNVGVDTSGELEDRQILQLDLAADGVGSGVETGSASGMTGSETVHDANVTTTHVATTEQTVSRTSETQTGTSGISSETQTSGTVESIISAPADFGAEIDTTGQTAGGEADVGIAAEVDGVGEGADVASDPADGLSTGGPGL